MKDSPLPFYHSELFGFSVFLKVPEMSPAFTYCMKPDHSICHSIICLTKKNAQKSHKVYSFLIILCTYRYEPLPFPKLYTFLLNMLEQFSHLLHMKEINIEHK